MLMQLVRVFFFTVICCLVTDAQANANAQWQLEKNEQEVILHSRTMESGLLEIKISTRIEGHYLALQKLLDDEEAAPLWVANCRKVEILGWFGDKERTLHTFFSSPWPLTDRDMLTTSKAAVDTSNQTLVISIENYGNRRQTQSHYVRVKDIKGQWTSVQIDENTAEITYQGYGDPGGAIPNWLANQLIKNSSFETFVNMRKQIKIERYQSKP